MIDPNEGLGKETIPGTMLFDIEADPSEKNNLAAAQPVIVQKLTEASRCVEGARTTSDGHKRQSGNKSRASGVTWGSYTASHENSYYCSSPGWLLVTPPTSPKSPATGRAR